MEGSVNRMKPIAVIGAGGYVGARLIERAELVGDLSLVPIVRSWRSQARLARYGVRTVRGDASDPASLVPLLKNCGTVVNLTMGDDRRMLSDVESIYEACCEAGVPLLVHLSSAEVFGRAEAVDLQEHSVPDGKHWMEYARAKTASEEWLRARADGPVKVVILRPGLIWGPGSGWLAQPAQNLVDGTAFFFNEGRGICNLIHVDNLIEHILQLARDDRPDSGVFNISDLETHTWADYYGAIAGEIGADESGIQHLPESAFKESLVQKLMEIGQLPPLKAIKKKFASGTKVRIKERLVDLAQPPIRQVQPIEPSPSVAKNIWWLQGTVHKLPSKGFSERYPEMQLQPFSELIASAGRWLRHAGYENATADPDKASL